MKKILYFALFSVVCLLIILPLYVVAKGEAEVEQISASFNTSSDEIVAQEYEQKLADEIAIIAAPANRDKLATGRKVLKSSIKPESMSIDEKTGALEMRNSTPTILKSSQPIPEVILRAARGESLLTQDEITDLYKKGFTYDQIEEAALQSLHAATVKSPESQLLSELEKTAEVMVHEQLNTNLDEINQKLEQRGIVESSSKEQAIHTENGSEVDRQ